MKTYRHIIATLLLVSISLTAIHGVSAKNVVKVDSLAAADSMFFSSAANSMVQGLRAGDANVIDSNLNHIVIFKTDFPEFQSDLLQDELGNIILHGPTNNIRYKAFLTLTYLDHQNDFGNLNELKYMIDHGDFNSIYLYLNERVKTDFILSATLVLTNN